MNNTNTQIDMFDTPPQIYDIDYENLKEVLSKATDVAYVYVPDYDIADFDISENKNIKKAHIFTSIEYENQFKSIENDSRFKIYYIDEYEKDPFKDCDTKFDYIYINRFDLAFKKSEVKYVKYRFDTFDPWFKSRFDYDPILCINILNDAIEHLKDENSILVHKTVDSELVMYKKGQQQVKT